MLTRRSMNRRDILQAHGLLDEPRWRQEAFWRRWNRPRAGWSDLAELAGNQWTTRIEPLVDQLAGVEEAWNAVLPGAYQSLTRIHGFDAGVLTVNVSSSTALYVLQRQLERTLRQALNEMLGRTAVKRIVFRLGSGRRPANKREG